MEYIITSEQQYQETMMLIYDLMNKSEANLSESDADKLSAITIAAEKFENEVLGLKPAKRPGSLPEVIELFMYENNISQSKLADQPGTAKPKRSQILTGKRKPDIFFKGYL